MPLTFSISAPQSVALPDGTALCFEVDPSDTSIVRLHVVTAGGSHVCAFKRNGEIIGAPEHVDTTDEGAAPEEPPQKAAPAVLTPKETTVTTNGPVADASAPYTSPKEAKANPLPYPSVDKDAVRSTVDTPTSA